MKQPECNVKITLQYPHNDKFDYTTQLVRIDLDKEREDDIRNGKGFIISAPKSIKKDIKLQEGIFSNRYGNTLQDDDSFMDRYRCDCGLTRGSINHGETCPSCGTMVKYRDDDMSIFGWIVLKYYKIIHPGLYKSLEAFIGAQRLNRIIEPDIQVDSDGMEIKIQPDPKKKDEIFKGIGIPEFERRFDEIMDYYLMLYPHKKNYYDDIMKHKNIVFTHSIPVFTTLLRPTKLDSIGSLNYEKTNENYNLLAHLVYAANKNKLVTDKQKKNKYELLYDIQVQFNLLYTELVKILKGKKGDIRSSIGGRYSFSERSVIKQDVYLMPDQVKLPYHGLCELLQQVIINILVRTYNFSYAEAYKKWYKAQIGFDQIVYDIIDGLIKDSDGGIPVLINRNPLQLGRYYSNIVVLSC